LLARRDGGDVVRRRTPRSGRATRAREHPRPFRGGAAGGGGARNRGPGSRALARRRGGCARGGGGGRLRDSGGDGPDVAGDGTALFRPLGRRGTRLRRGYVGDWERRVAAPLQREYAGS